MVPGVQESIVFFRIWKPVIFDMSSPYDYYDYLSFWEGRSYEDNSERIALERLLKKIPQKESLVDIGGGFGRFCRLYGNQFENCIVLDPSEKNLDIGRKTYSKYPNLKFLKGQLPALPFENGQFQTALMVRVAHHIKDLIPSFAEISRVLRNNGYFILEFANKNHFLVVFKAFFKGNFKYLSDLSPVEKRSQESIRENKITFVNHHPQKIISDLNNSGFEVIDMLSVSNFRNQALKKIVPVSLLLKLERIFQKPLSKIFFGPSIFILAKKR